MLEEEKDLDTVCYIPLRDVIIQDFNGDVAEFGTKLSRIVEEAGQITEALGSQIAKKPTTLTSELRTQADSWFEETNEFLRRVCHRMPDKLDSKTLKRQGEWFTYYFKICSYQWLLQELIQEFVSLYADLLKEESNKSPLESKA